ncbi:hypothetical protein [Rhodoferax sp.]|uniref:hypothetical protein n=1 Tax=Rhodoferax sp. TaxID=50421 RepID=UPI0025E1F965|nr:hypothetical protein [Rhodoferax sp.]
MKPVSRVFAWLDRVPLHWIVLLALGLGLAPFTPEPHLVEKVRMLMQGKLTRLLDIWDLLMHGAPLLLLLLKVARSIRLRNHRP